MSAVNDFLESRKYIELMNLPPERRTKRKLSEDEVRSRLNRKHKAKKRTIARRRNSNVE